MVGDLCDFPSSNNLNSELDLDTSRKKTGWCCFKMCCNVIIKVNACLCCLVSCYCDV